MTTAWLEAKLRAAGALDDARIVAIAHQPIGTGQVGDTVRFSIAYDRPDAGPATVAAKFASADPASRATAAAFGLYRQEAAFYRDLAGSLTVRTPRAFAVEIDAAGQDFVLLLEDLGPCRAGDQLLGCTLEEARLAIRQLAALHAPTFDARWLDEPQWRAQAEANDATVGSLYPQAHAIFRERYADALAPDLMAVCEAVAPLYTIWAGRPRAMRSVVHGDFRLDNLLFDVRGVEPIAVVDWQTTCADTPMKDLGYFLGCGIGSGLRRPHEDELLDLYLDEMKRGGVALARADLWDEYRLGALYGVVLAVFSAAFVARTERGDANFLSMARGATELALDHDSIGALRSLAGM